MLPSGSHTSCALVLSVSAGYHTLQWMVPGYCSVPQAHLRCPNPLPCPALPCPALDSSPTWPVDRGTWHLHSKNSALRTEKICPSLTHPKYSARTRRCKAYFTKGLHFKAWRLQPMKLCTIGGVPLVWSTVNRGGVQNAIQKITPLIWPSITPRIICKRF